METLLQILSQDEKAQVHERTLKILAETGDDAFPATEILNTSDIDIHKDKPAPRPAMDAVHPAWRGKSGRSYDRGMPADRYVQQELELDEIDLPAVSADANSVEVADLVDGLSSKQE